MEYIVFFAAVGVFILFVFVKGTLDRRREEKKFITSLYQDYGVLPKREYDSDRMKKIAGFYQRHPEDGQIDDITWNDLNLDEIYKKLNYTYSSAGEEYLYYLLRSPQLSGEVLKERETQIRFFYEHAEERVSLQKQFALLGFTGKFSIFDYLEHLDLLGKRGNLKHYVADLLIPVMILLCFFKPSYGLLGLAMVIVYNFVSYFKEKNEIDPYIICFSYVMRLLRCADWLGTAKEQGYEKQKEQINRCRREMSSFRRGSSWILSAGRMSGSGNPLDIFMDYLRMALHLDLIKFNHMLFQIREHRQTIDRLLEAMGALECSLAIGAYRASLQNWCVPEEGTFLQAQNMTHPLLTDPVPNSISAPRGVLLTGSNASGKSTFLKTVAINAIFAQTIHTCLAAQYSGPLFYIYSSMALRDDLKSQESYYIVEIKSIKRILDKNREVPGRVLCFVDEVLRGTNTVERIAASTQILKALASEGAICFAATHDIELAELLRKEYDNYHFEEEIRDGDVCFSYQLQEGKATTRNAIRLLGVMGYSGQLIQDAEEMSARFLKDGIWSTE